VVIRVSDKPRRAGRRETRQAIAPVPPRVDFDIAFAPVAKANGPAVDRQSFHRAAASGVRDTLGDPRTTGFQPMVLVHFQLEIEAL
jgi:hypothetical protein